MNDITTDELLEIIKNTGPRTLSALSRNGIANADALVRANPNLFKLSEGCSSFVVSLNNNPPIIRRGFKTGIAVGLVAATIVFLFFLLALLGNKNV